MITEPTFDAIMAKNRVPESLHGGLRRYLFDRVETGSFLRAVLENDLVEALAQADDNNRHQLHTLAGFMYNDLPGREYSNSPWGSKENVKAWLAEGQDRPRWL